MRDGKLNSNVQLRAMFDAAEKIDEIVKRWSVPVYDEGEVLQFALCYLSLHISQAAHRVSDELKAQYPAVAWTRLAETRQELMYGFSTHDLDSLWIAEADNALRLADQVARILRAEYGLEIEMFNLGVYQQEISAYCQTQPIQRLSEFAPGYEYLIRPHTDIGLLVDYSFGAGISLLTMAGHEHDLGDIIGKRVSLMTTKGLRQGTYKTPFEIGRRLYERQS